MIHYFFLLFFNEANFDNRCEINRHNCLYWSRENPHRAIPFLYRWSFNVWYGIVNGYIIGPYFYNGTLTETIHDNFIKNELPALLGHVDLATRAYMWFQHVTLNHNASRVCDGLKAMFPGRWIGRRGRVEWPACSPDLTPLVFPYGVTGK